jgi:peptidoglycan hydrolase-like protein with peptidoglycan-binding domain
MRFSEFKILLESKDNIVVIGDSIAVGIGGAGPYAKGGISTTEVLNRVNQFVQSGKAKGATVILSSGASNSSKVNIEGGGSQPANLAPIAQQIKTLRNAGATVALVGTGSGKSKWFPATKYTNGKRYQVDMTGVNQQLESIATANGAKFLGPLEEFDARMAPEAGGDGIHPFNGYKALYAAGAKMAPATVTPQATKPEQGGQPTTKPTSFSIEVPQTSLGWKGTGIADVQKALTALGYSVGPTGIDGIRGKYTIAAVRKYQEDRGLKVDGDPGPETVAAINKDIQSNPAKFNNIQKSQPSEVKQSAKVGKISAPKPVAYDAVTKGKIGEVLNFVAAPESRGYYDMMNGSIRKPEILKMTIRQANQFQRNWRKTTGNSSAMGRYQIMGIEPTNNTFAYAQKAGLDLDRDLFSPENQDKMGIIFLREKGLDAWLDGKMSDEKFLEGLSQVWAGLPAPSKGGRSYYDKVGNNKAGVGMDYAVNSLQNIRTG